MVVLLTLGKSRAGIAYTFDLVNKWRRKKQLIVLSLTHTLTNYSPSQPNRPPPEQGSSFFLSPRVGEFVSMKLCFHVGPGKQPASERVSLEASNFGVSLREMPQNLYIFHYGARGEGLAGWARGALFARRLRSWLVLTSAGHSTFLCRSGDNWISGEHGRSGKRFDRCRIANTFHASLTGRR